MPLNQLSSVPQLADKIPGMWRLCERISTLQHFAEELAENGYNTVNLLMALDSFNGSRNLKIFTYMSIVCQPLAVMTGWYGMNFVNLTAHVSYDDFLAGAFFVALLTILYIWYLTQRQA